MIKLIDLSKIYNKEVQALKDISLHIKPGEFVSVVGQSGSGKSTLVKLIIAEERPDAGKIIIGGWDIIGIKDRELPTLRRQLGVIFQDFKLLPKKTVFENVAFAMETCGFKSSEIQKTVSQIISLVGLKGKEDRYPDQLSGGEQQRVAVARALINDPKIIFADEPSGNLDSKSSDLLHKLFFDLRDKLNITFIIVTHNKELSNMTDRKLNLVDGKWA